LDKLNSIAKTTWRNRECVVNEMFRWLKKSRSPEKLKNLPELIRNLQDSGDFLHHESKQQDSSFFIYYFKTLVHETELNDHILPYLVEKPLKSL
ncbi:hypothetical protein R0K20_17510, partial [Staphylococcus sp. SIMBA_130]